MCSIANTALALTLGMTACLPDLKDDTAPSETEPIVDTAPPDLDGDGYSVGDGDCDDNDDTVNPGAEDTVGDGKDQNCDGLDGVDADADGYASTDSDGDDCDDTDATINPDGFDWNDGDDNDCDGTADSISTSLADGRWAGDMKGALVGASIAGVGDTNGDGKDDILLSAVEDPDASGEGAAYLLLGPADGEHGVAAANARLLGAASASNAWPAVAGAGDRNSDGYHDLLVGASGNSGGAEASGAVYLVRGPVAGDLYLTGANATLHGVTNNDNVGRSVDGAGDVDGDGVDDIIVGAPGWGTSMSGRGAAFVVTQELSGTASIESAAVRLYGESSGDTAGWSVAGVGDTNGDGLADMLVGAPYQSTGVTHNGAAYLLLGPASTDGSLASQAIELRGPNEEAQAGYSVDGAGDFDGDGHDDLLIGARWDASGGVASGTAFVVLGPVSASGALTDADLKALGSNEDDYAGHAVSGAGDLNGDGKGDMLVGAYGHDVSGANSGAVYLVLGGASGTFQLNDADAIVAGEQAGQQAGVSVAGVGDLNEDGAADFALGAWYYQGDNISNGAGFVFHGPGAGP